MKKKTKSKNQKAKSQKQKKQKTKNKKPKTKSGEPGEPREPGGTAFPRGNPGKNNKIQFRMNIQHGHRGGTGGGAGTDLIPKDVRLEPHLATPGLGNTVLYYITLYYIILQYIISYYMILFLSS